MKKLILALTVTGMATLPALAPAIAQEMDFATVDANADSMVAIDEAAAAGWTWTQDEFAAADGDGDGSLNAEEFAAATSG